MSCYRKCWNQITDFELSGLHWQQIIISYMNIGEAVYKHNHVEYLRIYMDDNFDEKKDPPVNFLKYPVGTIIVKENFSNQSGRPGNPLTLTIMVKHQQGYNINNGDWEYIQTNVDGQYIIGGIRKDPKAQKACANCHKSVSERDHVFGTFYSYHQN